MTAQNAEHMAAAFDQLVKDGVYDVGHKHAPEFVALFEEGLCQAARLCGSDKSLKVLELGCGAGAWIAQAQKLSASQNWHIDLYGSDISPNMVDLCRARFSESIAADNFFVGDILADSGYGGAGKKYDLIFTYDVIQQLPQEAQFSALTQIAARLSPGGVAVIFDNEADSPYGRKMARKKWLTRYLHLRLVPRFFCNARYPNLSLFSERLSQEGFMTSLVQQNGLHKRFLLIRRD